MPDDHLLEEVLPMTHDAFLAVQAAARKVADWCVPSCGWQDDVADLGCAIEAWEGRKGPAQNADTTVVSEADRKRDTVQGHDLACNPRFHRRFGVRMCACMCHVGAR